tara:strand:+ start:787 stop:1071 length:285 start_codon:yes stop_codon:yes gene_type:complete
MTKTRSILLILCLFFLNSCSVHTFTYGDGPSENFKKTVKQNNYVGGFISDGTPKLEELNDLKNYKLIVKHTFWDGLISVFSFGLYTPTTIIIIR